MEYGWNRVGDPLSHGRSISDNESHQTKDDYADSVSMHSQRSSKSRLGWKDGSLTVRAGSSPYSERTFINEWKPPMPPSVPSTHDEEAQLEALRKHVASMKEELQIHNEMRSPMMQLVRRSSLVMLFTVSGLLYILWLFTVSREVGERQQGTQQLGKEVSVPPHGDRQVRIIHRLAAVRHGTPTEETWRESSRACLAWRFRRRRLRRVWA